MNSTTPKASVPARHSTSNAVKITAKTQRPPPVASTPPTVDDDAIDYNAAMDLQLEMHELKKTTHPHRPPQTKSVSFLRGAKRKQADGADEILAPDSQEVIDRPEKSARTKSKSSSVITYAEDEAEVEVGDIEEDEAEMEDEAQDVRVKNMTVDGERVRSVALGKDRIDASERLDMFYHYVGMCGIEACIPDPLIYLHHDDRVSTKADAGLLMAINTMNKGYRYIRTHMRAMFEKLVAVVIKLSPTCTNLMNIVATSYRIEMMDLPAPNENGEYVAFTDGSAITDSDVPNRKPVMVRLIRDPRKFKPVGDSRIGDVSSRASAKLNLKDPCVLLRSSEYRVVSAMLQYLTFPDHLALEILNFRDKQIAPYVEACHDRSKSFSLTDCALMTMDALMTEKGKAFKAQRYAEFLAIQRDIIDIDEKYQAAVKAR